MRKLFVLLLALPFVSIAQELEVGQKWQYEQWWWDSPGRDTVTTIEVTGDTIINGEEYLTIRGGCVCADTLRYIREEGNKYFSYYKNDKHLLYDFNLDRGDTLKIKAPFQSSQDSIYVRIDSIGRTLIDGEEFMVQYIDPYLNDPGNTHWADWGEMLIKGIGSNWCLTPQYALCEDQTVGLSCVRYSDGRILQVDQSKACIYVNTNSRTTHHTKVYPNPSHGNISITHNGFTKAVVMNVEGQRINEVYANGSNEFILTLEPGFYFVVIENKGTSEVIELVVH